MEDSPLYCTYKQISQATGYSETKIRRICNEAITKSGKRNIHNAMTTRKQTKHKRETQRKNEPIPEVIKEYACKQETLIKQAGHSLDERATLIHR